MIFSEKSIIDLLAGRKEQTRRLVKEGEELEQGFDTNIDKEFDLVFKWQIDEDNMLKRNKWCVGNSYAVQKGRGKNGKGLWYCPKCKSSGKPHEFISENKLTMKSMAGGFCFHEIKPLRVKITGIKKERLLDISEEDAKREGYNSKEEFFASIINLNIKNIPQSILDESLRKAGLGVSESINKLIELWNPFVWVLSICLEGGLDEEIKV